MAPESRKIVDLTPFPIVYRNESVLLHKLFQKYGYDLRIAGGAVRDILLGNSPHDVDFATNATPQQMNEMFTNENIRMLHRNGESHGTVTVRINDEENFEITTLRVDVNPGGRHTEVKFVNNWKLDAERRDLTVNSMFLEIDPTTIPDFDDSKTNASSNIRVIGRLYDYFNGNEDLELRRIRFVGDADRRIKEDYLRILRYFRFHGRLSNIDTCDNHEDDILKIIANNKDGLQSISGERCWMELQKILLLPSSPYLIHRMYDAGLFPSLGLPLSPNLDFMTKLYKQGFLNHNPNPATCLVTLLNSIDDLYVMNKRLKLSNHEFNIILYILKKRDWFTKISLQNRLLENELNEYKKEFYLSQEAPNRMKPILEEMMYYVMKNDDFIKCWSEWIPNKLPVNGDMIRDEWRVSNKLINRVLIKLRVQWIESDYTLNKEELISSTNRDKVMKDIDNFIPDLPALRLETKKLKR